MADRKSLTRFEIRYIPAAKLGPLFLKANGSDPDAFLPVEQLEVIDMPGMNNTRRAVTHPRNLLTIYQQYQAIDGTDDERTKQLGCRSMTTGDAIVVNGVAYYKVNEDHFPSGFATKAADGKLVDVTEENCGS